MAKKKRQNDKQWSTKHYKKHKYRQIRTPLKPGVNLGDPER